MSPDTTTITAAPTHLWTDDELLARMVARDAQAWREFHRRFDRLVYRWRRASIGWGARSRRRNEPKSTRADHTRPRY